MDEAVVTGSLHAGMMPVPGDGWFRPEEGLGKWWLKVLGWAFLAYTGLFVMSTIQGTINIRYEGLTVQWPLLLTSRALDEYSSALFVPPIFLLVRRFPLDRGHWRVSVLVLLAATTVAVGVKYALTQPVLHSLFPAYTASISSAIATNMLAVLFDFWAVVAVAQAIDFHRRAQERGRLAVQLRERLTQAQLDALRSRLQPHFLFNTLNGAATLLHRDPEGADRMLNQLAELLRLTLAHGGAQEIPLREEMGLLERYLGIMRVRLGDRLSVTFDVPEGLSRGAIPPFLLQPLVENALEHGIGARPGRGRLHVRAWREGASLRITITDDGPGIQGGVPDAGMGLSSSRERLARMYGDGQSLTVEAASPSGGTRVAIVLPWHEAAPTGEREGKMEP